MGDALFDLEQSLRSTKEKLTSQEANVLMQCKGKAIRDFSIGSGAGAGIAWLATRRLSNLFRINIAGGTAIFSGLWRFTDSLDSCVEHILGMEGTRMQRELANIMLRKHRDNPMTTRLISKHFYSEKVFDESSSDQAKLRWRYRNSSGDNLVHSSRTQDSYGEQTTASSDHKTNIEPQQQVSVNSGTVHAASNPFADDAASNPFDCVFGPSVIRTKEIQWPGSSGTSPKRHNRSHKRSRRRNRMRNHEDSTNLQHT